MFLYVIYFSVCQYESAIVFFSGCASITTLATMSVMRYIKTCHAPQGKNDVHTIFYIAIKYLSYSYVTY